MDKLFERTTLIAILIILAILTWAIVKPALVDMKNVSAIVKAVNKQGQSMEIMQQSVIRLQQEMDLMKTQKTEVK